MSILTQKQEQALLDLELYLANPEVLPTLPATKPPPLPPPPPTSAQKPAIFNTGESKKRYGEAVTQDEKESEKRLKVTQAPPVAPVTPVTPVTPVASAPPQDTVPPSNPSKPETATVGGARRTRRKHAKRGNKRKLTRSRK